VVNAIGKDKLKHIYELADVYHCENIDKISDELIETYYITQGDFDNVAACQYRVPTHWDIGKVYKRLIVDVVERQSDSALTLIDALIEVYNSWITRKIDDYNCSAYYENQSYLYESYIEGEML
jgi:hypothetical protein